jgi:hypothetical protein
VTAKAAFSAWADGDVRWSYVQDRLAFPGAEALPIPLPFPDDIVRLRTSLTGDTAANAEVRFEVEYGVAEIQRWGLTFGRTCRLIVTVTLRNDGVDDVVARFDDGDPAQRLSGAVSAEVFARLPPLPQLESVRIRSGDAAGWIRVRLAVLAPGSALRLRLDVSDPLEIDVDVPGLGVPLARLTGRSLGGEVTLAQGSITGTLTSSGDVNFRPRFAALDLPLAAYLGHLLDEVAPDAISVNMTVDFQLNGAEPAVTIRCELEGAGVSLELFQVLRDMTRGIAPPSDVPAAGQAGPAMIGCSLSGFWIRLSRSPEMALRMRVGGADVLPEVYLKIAPEAVSLGLGTVEPGEGLPAVTIPLRLPHVDRSQFGFRGRASESHADPQDKTPIDQRIWSSLSDEGKVRYDNLVELFLDSMELVSGARPSGLGLVRGWKEGNVWRIEAREDAAAEATQPAPFRVALGTVLDGNRSDTGNLLLAVQIDDAWHLLAANPALLLERFAFRISMRNPRDISVSGTARFVVDGPLEKISDVAVTAGISADLIFFAADVGGAQEIAIPELVPGYGGGKLILGRLAFGFGYTKRSAAIAFDGGIVLPERFVDDLDTSGSGRAGIRLPVQSRVALQLDVVPLTIGQAVIPIPMLQFNVDLRRSVSPGLRDPRTCEPWWDGLQIIVNKPVKFRASLKRISYNPLLGMGMMSNSDFDGDVVLGDATNGLSIVADNIFWAYGNDGGYALSIYPIASPPFADNVCVSVRLAGCGVHFHIERPVPSFSPLSVFEILALIADPVHYEVRPDGDLANMVRASLNDAYITVPDALQTLFPGLAARAPLNITINLATYIRLTQVVAKTFEGVALAAATTLRDAESRRFQIEPKKLITKAGEIDRDAIVRELLAALPSPLRRIAGNASFGGFDASAVLVLMNAAEAKDAFDSRGVSESAQSPAAEITRGMGRDWKEMRRFVPKMPRDPRKLIDTAGPENHPLRDAAFDLFTAEDLVALEGIDGAPVRDGSAMLVTASVRLLKAQRTQFLGFVSANGAFALVTRARLSPLTLQLPGIRNALELQFAAQARLELVGHLMDAGGSATVKGKASVEWDALPLVVRVAAKVALEVRSDGAFSASGSGKVTLFGERAAMAAAAVSFDRTHCRVSGQLTWSGRDIGLLAAVLGAIGPESRYELEGRGTLSLLGASFGAMHVRVTERRIELAGRIAAATTFHLARTELPCTLEFAARGAIEFGVGDVPDVAVSGAALLALEGIGITVHGHGGLSLNASGPQFSIDGTMSWMGHEWVGGRAEMANERLLVEGRTSMTFRPNQVRVGADVTFSPAPLQLQLNVHARYAVGGSQASLTLTVEAIAGLQLGPADDAQVAPLAMARVEWSPRSVPAPFRGNSPAAQSWDEPFQLLQFRGFGPVPDLSRAAGVSLPVPGVTLPDHARVTLRVRKLDLTLDPPKFVNADVTVVTPHAPGVSWPNPLTLSIADAISLPSFDLFLRMKWEGGSFVLVPEIRMPAQ